MQFTRRELLALTAASLVPRSIFDQSSGGRLRARPHANTKSTAKGVSALGLDATRDAYLSVPADVSKPVPLFVAFHGAGQSASWMMDTIGTIATESGVAVLAPYSRYATWDAIRGDYAADVSFIDRALEKTYGLLAVDPARVALGGFSDGATYALSLGRINGDAFSRIVAFSPGFVIDGTAAGRPEFFITHGTDDRILPIDRCSRMIVPALKREGYAVTYKEFDGGHRVEPTLAREAMVWVRRGT